MCILHKLTEWPWQTIWAAVQALGVPISLYAAIRLPQKWRDAELFKDLLSYRNIYNGVVRWLPRALTIDTCNKDNLEQYLATLDSCIRIAQSIPLDKIYPSDLIEHFAAIDVHSCEISRLMKAKDPQRFRVRIELCLKWSNDALETIDMYLRPRGVRLGKNNALIASGRRDVDHPSIKA
jgi:hypothetical protein